MTYPAAPETGIQVLAMVIETAGSPSLTLRYSTHGFTTGPTDSPANTYFDGRIINEPVYRRAVGCVYWGNKSSTASLGEVDTTNADAELDSIAVTDLRNSRVKMYRGTLGTAFSTWVQIVDGTLDRTSVPDENTVRWHVYDRSALFARALQSSLYVFDDGYPRELAGQPKPISFGRPLSVPAVLASPTLMNYDVNDGAFKSVIRVRDRGVELAGPSSSPSGWEYTSPAFYGFTLTANPDGKIVADLEGATSGIGSPTALVYQLEKVIKHLTITHGPLTNADLNLDSIADLEVAAPYELSAWFDQPITISAAMDMVMVSFGGWWYFDRLGRLSVGRLSAPSSPVLEFGPTEIIGPLNIEFDRAEGLSTITRGQKNWYQYAESDIAGSVTPEDQSILSSPFRFQYDEAEIAPVYAAALNGGAGGIETILTDADDIVTQGERTTALYGVGRWFVTFGAAMSLTDLLSLEPGQTITVTADRYGITGRDMLITAIEFGLISNVARITGWCEL